LIYIDHGNGICRQYLNRQRERGEAQAFLLYGAPQRAQSAFHPKRQRKFLRALRRGEDFLAFRVPAKGIAPAEGSAPFFAGLKASGRSLFTASRRNCRFRSIADSDSDAKRTAVPVIADSF
jgi:hypothetical protein